MRKIFIKGGLLSFIAVVITAVLLMVKVYADSTIIPEYTINQDALYSETNTFDYTFGSNLTRINYETAAFRPIEIPYLFELDRCEERYDMSDRNDNTVTYLSPQITVFTHGWGDGCAANWDAKFGGSNRDDNSLVQKLYDNNPFSNVYLAKFSDKEEFELYDVTTNFKYQSKIDLSSAKKVSIHNGIENGCHSIIVFEAINPGFTHDYIYNQFNYMLSKIVLQYKIKFNNGVLPKINLIGHSRGGITNMQYALDHPDLVDSMYSYNTPYMGTSTAGLTYQSLAADTLFKIFGFGSYNGAKDLANSTLYNLLCNRWNNRYNELYSHINVKTICATTEITLGIETFFNLLKAMIRNLAGGSQYMLDLIDVVGTVVANSVMDIIFEQIFGAIWNALNRLNIAGKGTLVGILDSVVGIALPFIEPILFKAIEAKVIENTLKEEWYKLLVPGWVTGEAIYNFAQINISLPKFILDINNLILNEMNIINKLNGSIKFVWDSDIAVNIESQRGYNLTNSYRGFNLLCQKSYEILEYCSGITHMLTLKDNDIHNKVINNISINNREPQNKIELNSCKDYIYKKNIDINGDQKYCYTFDVKNSGKYTIETTGNVDTIIEIYSSYNKLLSRNDDFYEYDDDGELIYSDRNAKVDVQLYTGSLYYVVVQGYSSYSQGTSTLNISREANNIYSGQIVNVTGKFIYLSKFVPSISSSYTIETSGSTDSYMYLYDSSMNQLDQNDDDGEGNNALITYNFVAGRTYYVGICGCFSYTNGQTTITYASNSLSLIAGNQTVVSNTKCSYTATSRQLVFIETTEWYDTKFNGIVCDNSDYTYNDDTLICDDDGDYIDSNAWIGVVLEAGQSITFTVSGNYSNYNINILLRVNYL